MDGLMEERSSGRGAQLAKGREKYRNQIFTRGQSGMDVIYGRQTKPTPIKQTAARQLKRAERRQRKEGKNIAPCLTYLANGEP